MNKKIEKNYIYNLIYQIIVLILPVIAIPYLSRVLRVKGIGIYNYITSIVMYFMLLGSLEIAMYA
jgi:O-antigen/teichoic acid export membrane protein